MIGAEGKRRVGGGGFGDVYRTAEAMAALCDDLSVLKL